MEGRDLSLEEGMALLHFEWSRAVVMMPCSYWKRMELIDSLNLWVNKRPLVFAVQTDFEYISKHWFCIEGVGDFCFCELYIELHYTFIRRHEYWVSFCWMK